MTLGNSDAVKVGDVVLAVGNPLGIGQTVTMGIISAKGRSTGVGDGSYEDFLQTDAPINHGNSGGALVNTKGELVGINSQIVSNSDGNIGIGFAIPANMAKPRDGPTCGRTARSRARSWASRVQPVTTDMAESLGLKQAGGVIVSSVAPGSAAERAGLKRGDVIRSLNGQAVHDTNTLAQPRGRSRVRARRPSSSIVRDGAEKHVSVKLDEARSRRARQRERRRERPRRRDGPDGARRLGRAADAGTGRSRSALPSGHARASSCRMSIRTAARRTRASARATSSRRSNRQPVTSVEDLRTAVRRNSDKPTLLLISREGADIFVTVKPARG